MAASGIGPRVIRLEPDGMNARLQYIRRVRLTFAVVALVLLAGCGGDDTADYQNKPRPPAPINVTAAIDGDRVRVSPVTFGSGPVVFIISNQSGAPQTVTFETDELGGDERRHHALDAGDRFALDRPAEGRPARGDLHAQRQRQ